MSLLDSYFHAPHRAARSHLLSKVFLAMVALDMWMLMIGHAGRYGVDGFNVAHFTWLDRIQPLPTAGLYVGVLLLSGLLALCIALGVGHRLARIALFLLYTFSWSMSMLDSYQHHYFVSSVLLCLVFFPQPLGSEIHDARRRTGQPLLVSAFGFNLLGAIVSILYAYTSVAKMDAQWCAGHTIKRISSAEKVFATLVDAVAALGVSRERFWALFATAVIPAELMIAAGYLLAVRQDASSSRMLRTGCLCAWLLAISLHVGAEAMGLEIGWFSYYMLLLACVFLLPGPVVDRLATLVTWPARFTAQQLADFTSHGPGNDARLPTLVLGLVTAGLLCAVGYMIDLPGALAAGGMAALLCAGFTPLAVLRKHATAARLPLCSTALAAALKWTAIAHSEVRWDFYRYLGGDLRRRGQPEAALQVYEHGERYAPAGQSRRDKIAELRQQLGR